MFTKWPVGTVTRAWPWCAATRQWRHLLWTYSDLSIIYRTIVAGYLQQNAM